MSVLNKESLSNSLVDDDQCDCRFFGTLVVHHVDDLLELSDLLLDDLPSHSISDTISVDDEVIWEHSLRMSLLKCLDGLLQSFCQVGVNNLLTFLLEDLVRVVLTELLVD